MSASIFTSLCLSEKCGGASDESLAGFARRIRDRLMWTILEWSLGDSNRISKMAFSKQSFRAVYSFPDCSPEFQAQSALVAI